MAGSGAVVHVSGLRELQRAFQRMDRDVAQDLVWELQEAADPVRKATEQMLLADLVNLPPTPYYAGMRIGVSRAQGSVYIAPAWHARRVGPPRPTFGSSIAVRMEAAVERHADEVEQRLDKWLDRMADEWGRGG